MKFSAKEAFKQGIVFPLRNSLIHANRLAGNFQDVIWLIGDGRSGTTWVSSIINSKGKARELFEPYHPLIHKNAILEPYLYSEAASVEPALLQFYEAIFSGKLVHRRVDFDNRKLLYDGLIVKDIFINLSAHPVVKHFQNVKPVLLIRNPFAVVASKIQKKHWFWPSDPDIYLNNVTLMSRLTSPMIELLKLAKVRNNFAEIQFIHWALGHHILFDDFSEDSLHIIFYEDMQADPNRELSRLKDYLGPGFEFVPGIADKSVITKSSRVVGKNKERETHLNTLEYWKKKLSDEDFKAGLQVLKTFGLESAYADDGDPNYPFFSKFGFKN